MKEAEISLQWQLARFGFRAAILGAIIGGAATFCSSYWVWDKQQDTLNQQQAEELGNIAGALYIDISIIEDRLNKTIIDQSIKIGKYNLNDPSLVYSSDTPYYPDYGLYHVFNKDISRFDNKLSQNLYKFYSNIIELENRRKFTRAIHEKLLRNQTVSSHDKRMAHIYTLESIKKLPIYINDIDILKKGLMQRYPSND